MRTSFNLLFYLSLILSGSVLYAQIEVRNPVVIDLKKVGLERPQGITYHPERGTLFIVTEVRAFEVSLEGQILKSFQITKLTGQAQGVAYDPFTGRLLICEGTDEIFQIEPDGTLVSPRQVISVEDRKIDLDDLVVDPVKGTIWGTSDHRNRIYEIDRQGKILSEFSLSDILPSITEPQAIGLFGSNVLVADDSQGSASIFLFSKSGALLQFVLDPTLLDVDDPEGITSVGDEHIFVVSDWDSKLLRFDAASSPVRQTTLSAPFSTGIDGTFVGVAAVNAITASNPIEIQNLTPAGRLDSSLSESRVIPALGQTTFLTLEILKERDAAMLTATGLNGPIQGFFMIGDFELQRLDGIGRALQASTILFIPEAHRKGEETTVLYIFNPSFDTSTDFRVQLFDPSGQLIREFGLRLEPEGSLIGPLEQLFGEDLALDDGYLRLEASSPVQSFALFAKPESFSTIGGQVDLPVRKFFVPHFFVTEDGTTRLRLLNLESETRQVDIELFGNDARKLASRELKIGPQSLIVFDLAQMLNGSPAGGYFNVQVEGDEARLIATVTFAGRDEKTLATLPLLRQGQTHVLFLHVAQSSRFGVFQGLAIANLTGRDNQIILQAFDPDGRKTREATFWLPPRQRIIGLLNEDVFLGATFEQVGGYLRILTSAPVSAFSLFGGENFLSAIEGQSTFNDRSYEFLRP